MFNITEMVGIEGLLTGAYVSRAMDNPKNPGFDQKKMTSALNTQNQNFNNSSTEMRWSDKNIDRLAKSILRGARNDDQSRVLNSYKAPPREQRQLQERKQQKQSSKEKLGQVLPGPP